MAGNKEKFIQMLDYQKPSLESGRYKISIQQSIKLKDSASGEEYQEKGFQLYVAGDRFALGEDAVYACFPPAGALGRYTDVLPHISLSRSTLPWERSAYGNEDFEPWVALLVFDETELFTHEVIEQPLQLSELKLGNGEISSPEKEKKKVFFPKIGLEQGQLDSDKVTVINVKKSLLEKTLPSGDELKLLSHVRKSTAIDTQNAGQEIVLNELAVTVANRFPREGSESSMYLVSVENRYTKASESAAATFNYEEANDDDYIRLIVLKKWGFACLSDMGEAFEELAEGVDVGTLCLPSEEPCEDASIASTRDHFINQGYVPLPHSLRQADKTYSWYHSPLAPIETSLKLTNAIASSDSDLPDFADELIYYHEEVGMFDASYSAAFELGKMLALEDVRFSTSLYEWKQGYNETMLAGVESKSIKTILGSADSATKVLFALQGAMNAAVTLPDGVETTGERFEFLKAWLKELRHLASVPYNYLVPEGEMLPRESMRFFKLDKHWMESLLLGAFSVGGRLRERDSKSDKAEYKSKEQINLLNKFFDFEEAVSGFIINSELVRGFPDLQMDGFSADKKELPILRSDRLGQGVMIVLFHGNIESVELYLKPEGLRFGLDIDGDGQLSKNLISDRDSKDIEPEEGRPWMRDATKRVVNINNLAQSIKARYEAKTEGEVKREGEAIKFGPAIFAMYMLDGANKVVFKLN